MFDHHFAGAPTPSGRGLLSTAIAYSNAKPNSRNRSDSYFALDPERANGRHLCPAFARLQGSEAYARPGTPSVESPGPRRTYAWRGRNFQKHFVDPWFDGGTASDDRREAEPLTASANSTRVNGEPVR